MYKIKGSDDREYGPASLEQIQHWIREGRVNSRTLVLGPDATEWKPAAEYAEFNLPPVPPAVPAPGGSSVAPAFPTHPQVQERGLAVTSLVLGILSLVCFGIITGIPAIICGHIAHNRARREATRYGGAGLAIAGFVTGYVGLLLTILVLPALLLPALAKAKDRAQSINCVNNLKEVGLGFRAWELDHNDQYPFNVSSKDGGTQEASHPAGDGFEPNPVPHFQALSNELSRTAVLICPADNSKQAALDFSTLQAANVSYRLRAGPELSDTNPQLILAVCPVHGHELLCDGSVVQRNKRKR